jgi:hypothetical protein
MFKKLLQLIGFMPKNVHYVEENVIKLTNTIATDVMEAATEFKTAATEVATEVKAAADEVASDIAASVKPTRAVRKPKDTTTEKKPRKSKKKSD